MKKRNKPSLKKYMTGTAVKDYLPDPSEAITQNQINIAKAQYKAESNPWTQLLQIAGNTAMGAGLNMMGAGQFSGIAKQAANAEFATGGKVNKVSVEVEGDEVMETPDGKVAKFKGPDHEEGGIPISLPEGTEIFSKRIKKMGETMAQRKMNREKKVDKAQKMLNKNPGDILTKKTLEKIKQNNEKEEKADMELQEAFTNFFEEMACGGRVRKHADGGIVGQELNLQDNLQSQLNWNNPMQDQNIIAPTGSSQYQMESPQTFAEDVANTPSSMGTSGGRNSLSNYFSNINIKNPPTGGDVMGLVGTGVSALSPLLNTLKNRAGDTPNVNYYKDYGRKGLKTVQESQQYIDQQKDKSLRDLQSSRAGALRRGRSSSQSINTARALDLATEQAVNKAQGDIYSNFANQMMQSMNTQAQMENQRDQVVMGGERERITSDIQDRDQFYTNRGKALLTLGSGMQAMGSNMNQMYARGQNTDMINQIKDAGIDMNQFNNFLQMFLKSKA